MGGLGRCWRKKMTWSLAETDEWLHTREGERERERER